MGEIVNPYIAGAPVTEQRMFFGRKDIFQWIENSIAGQYADHILVVHGQRRVGKTSVLKQLGNRLPKRYIPVFFDLQGRTHTSLDHFLWWLAREIVRVLKQERGIEVPPPNQQAFIADPEYFENQFLTGLRSVLGNNTLLLTFDEFDNLEESEIKETLARPLVDHLRRLMGQPNLNFIFSIGSSGRKLENMQAAYTDFFKTALYKKISFLSEEQTHNLVTRPVEGVIEYERGAVDRIYGITSGHPYFTQLTCHELFARCQRTEQRKIAKADVEAILDDVVERGTVNLKFVWDEASDIEKWSLAALAQLDKTDNRTVADYLRKNRVRFSESDLTSGLLRLREKYVLTPENRFVIHLLKIWLQKNRPIEQAREELTEANPIASRFIEIGLEFRDGGQHEKAIEYFRQALSVSSDNLQAQVNIALTYAAQGLLDQAVAEFEKALVMDDEDVASRSGLCEAHLKLGDIAMSRKRTQDAIQSYQRILRINAEHTEARQRMAEMSRQRAEKALTDGRDEDALSAFAEALKFTPDDPSLIERIEKVRAEKKAKVLAALLARSEKEANVKSWEKSLATLNEALEVAPQDKSILAKIASVKAKQLKERLDGILAKADQAEKSSRWDAAISALGEYLAIQPDDAAIQKRLDHLRAAKRSAWLSAVRARADAAVASERWDEAVAALNEVFSLEPGNAEFAGKMEQVRAAQKAAELKAILRRAEQAALDGRWDEAVTALNTGLATEPENETLKVKLAEARKAKREARLQAAMQLADTAAQAGKWEDAVEALNDVLAVEPDNAEFQKKLSEVRAQEHVSQWNAARTQAESLMDAEQFDNALQAWQVYLSLRPGDRDRVEKEIKQVTQERELLDLYTNAGAAIAVRDFDQGIRLLKEIIIRDENYKDASRLLTTAIELRRTGSTQKLGKPHKKTDRTQQIRTRGESKPGNRRIWIIGGLLAILILGIGGGVFWLVKNGLPAMPAPITDNTATPTPTGNTIIVTSAEDSGPGTLRQALLDAQAGDTITFDPGIFPPDRPTTIFLTSESLPRISRGSLTIDASNAGVILDGSKLPGVSDFGLVINSDHNTVMGLQIINISGSGIYIEGGSYNMIGGDRTIGAGPLGQGNLLSNNYIGISLLSMAGGNVITGNLIGTDKSGMEPLGNWKGGIWIEDNQSYNPVPNIIGPDNLIAFNGTDVPSGEIAAGVGMDTAETAMTITGNSIYDNAGPGIFYNVDDAARIKYSTPPVILYFDLDAGTVNGQTCKDCVVEIFSTETEDGEIYEGTVTADEYGNFSFSPGRVFAGPFLTATTHSTGENTSEFSQPTSAISAIQIALDAIQNEAPVYQTSFDTWDFGDPVDYARVEDGKLILTSTGAHVPVNLSTPGSDMFAVEFDLRILDSGPEGHCIFYTSTQNEGTVGSRSIATVFYFNGNTELLGSAQDGTQEVLALSTFEASRSNKVKLVVLEDKIATFLNGQLAYTALDPYPDVNAVYNGIAFAATYTIGCEYDNYKIWDLSGVDFSASETTSLDPAIQIALDAIQNEAPLYQTGFDTSDFVDLQGGAKVENGKLILTSENQDGATVNPSNLSSDMYAVEFEFRVLESGSNSSCVLETINEHDTGESKRAISAEFYPDGSAILSRYVYLLVDGHEPIAMSKFDETKSNTVTLIILGDQIDAFVNGQMAYTALDPDGSAVYTHQNLSAYNTIVCEYDNYKFWDLSGVDFSASTVPAPTPTATTVLSTPLPTSCNGMAYVNDVTIPDNTPMKPGQTFTKTWKVRNSGTCAWDAGFKFAFTGGDAMGGATYTLPESVAANKQIDISIEMTAPNKTGSILGKWRMSTAAGQFFGDEVYVTILIGGAGAATNTIEPVPKATAPSWVTDFSEPILASIAGRTPNVDDGFPGGLMIYHTWVTSQCSPPGSIKYEKELIVSNCDFEWTVWYTDFVIEMDYRFLSGDNWSIYFRGLQGGFTFNNNSGSARVLGGTDLDLPAILPGERSAHVVIIVKDQAAALFVNDRPTYYGNLDPGWKSGDVLWTVRDSTVAFDNFKIWNLNLP